MTTRKLKPRRPMPRAELTDKQNGFVHWYCSAEVNLNGREAARRAGYRGNDNTLSVIAHENLSKPNVRAAIDKRIKKALSGADVTVEAVLCRIQVIGDKALEDGQYSAAVRAAELHGRYLKMFTERIEHVQSIEEITTEELLRLLHEIAEAGGIDLRRPINENRPEEGGHLANPSAGRKAH